MMYTSHMFSLKALKIFSALKDLMINTKHSNLPVPYGPFPCVWWSWDIYRDPTESGINIAAI